VRVVVTARLAGDRKHLHLTTSPSVSLAAVLQVGDTLPEATVFLGPNEPMTILELLEDGPKLLVFYLFDWSST
jgi:hypothetical protein